MRRSILIVMLDVMVLSVLALTAGQRAGGSRNIPVPLYRWSSMIEEGLRKEQAFIDEVKRLEEQLSQASELAKKALDQADKARNTAGREREGGQEMQERMHSMQLEAERARFATDAAKRDAVLAQQGAELARRQMQEAENRRIAAEQATKKAARKAEEFGERTATAETAVRQAEKIALLAEKEAALAKSEGQRYQFMAQTAETALETIEAQAEDVSAQVQKLQMQLAARDEKMTELQVAEATAQERARTVVQERARLITQGEQATEKVVELSGKVAELEVRKEDAEKTVLVLEEEQRLAEEERQKSIWIRRDEALRRMSISYTEYNSRDQKNFVTRRELVMPLVQVGRAVLVPADFRKLGLGRSFFWGLSDTVTQVKGTVQSVQGSASTRSLESIIMPGKEPQICFIRFSGAMEGALKSISMETLKEQRIKKALLFSSSEMNEHGRVEVIPVIGSDYLSVRRSSGKRPKVGDYLLTDRGEFIGVMVTSKQCYVTPQVLTRTPEPIVIPIMDDKRDGLYFKEFIGTLNRARNRMDEHLKRRKF